MSNKLTLRDALQLAIRQNEHDMVLTGEELRACNAALASQAEAEKQCDLLYRAEDINQGRAGLREAAQNALATLDGIADTNPRDTADFETPAEWITWAKSRARWAADALRAPVAQEIYAERVLKNMMQEADRRSAFDTLPDDYEAPH